MTEQRPDTQSDPAKDDEQGSEWSDEGGATPEGPATDETADEGAAGGGTGS